MAVVAAGAAIGGSVVTVEPSVVVGDAAPDLWGIFLEDLDLALDGGLYAEMVCNRSFEDGTFDPWDLTLDFWNPVGNAELYRHGSLRAAIAEAAFMLGLERNSAQVKFAAYAPLFAHEQHVAWSPNLIYHSGYGSFVNPSWNVQRLFSENRGTQVLKVSVETGREQKGIDNVQANAVRTGKGEIVVKLVNCTEVPDGHRPS